MVVSYPVMEHFYTIQGEGRYTGYPAYFIRLGGCDVGCVWCDVKDSWDADKHPKMSVTELLNEVKKTPSKIVVITGGEPAMHDLSPLVDALKSEGFRAHIETSGAHPISGQLDWVCLSPKKFKAPLKEALALANEFKVVVFHPSDIEWASKFLKDLPIHCELFLQPEWSKAEIVLPLIIDFVKSNPNWKISLQTHKFLNIP